jgi:activator of 2-hydroxyglutaryl-CoA dehydratase
MNEICAAGTGAFLDEQAARLGIPIESFGEMALKSRNPAPIAGRCAVFAKTDMIHKAQEGAPIPDILMGLAFALVRNYIAGLIKGEPLVPLVSLQGGVMLNQAVVHAFQHMLELEEGQITRPPHFTVLGALGCAQLAAQRPRMEGLTLASLRQRAVRALNRTASSSFLPPLDPELDRQAPSLELQATTDAPQPLVMGIDVGSVSVKGVLIDGHGRILKEDYRLSRSLPLETMTTVMEALVQGEPEPALLAVTGSGRYLAGRLLDADLIVNEISAQARAALSHDPGTETIVEIGGQDSKWISLESCELKDFEMNRVRLRRRNGKLPHGAGRQAGAGPGRRILRCSLFSPKTLRSGHPLHGLYGIGSHPSPE